MHASEVFGLTTYLHDLYRERFPPLGDSMARIWYEDLKHLDEDLVTQAINRWARQHTHLPPSLEQILEQVEFVREDQRQPRRQGSSTTSYLAILTDAGAREAQSPARSADDATYAQFMVLLGERSMAPWTDAQGVRHAKLTQEQRGDQCYTWAEQVRPAQPALATDLETAARQFLVTLPLQFGD